VLLGDEAALLTDEALAAAKKKKKLWFWQEPPPEGRRDRLLWYASWAVLPGVGVTALVFDGVTYFHRFGWLDALGV
jgi:hypothetical protein